MQKENYELSNHAKEVMEERNISYEILERTLFDPMLIEKDKFDSDLEHRLSSIPENENRVLRIIINILTIPIKVVTLFYDRRMRGKL